MADEREEYYLLEKKLEEITWALEGSCNDVDCDKYTYRNLFKKRYKPVLNHGFSCLPSLRREKEAVMRLLSLKKFRKFRYRRCEICKKNFDSLGKKYTIVSFLRPSKFKGQKAHEYKGVSVHEKCKKRVHIPLGWEKAF